MCESIGMTNLREDWLTYQGGCITDWKHFSYYCCKYCYGQHDCNTCNGNQMDLKKKCSVQQKIWATQMMALLDSNNMLSVVE